MAGSATWTTPSDWTDGDFVDETDMNEQVRDNLTYLYETAIRIPTAPSALAFGGNSPFSTDGSGNATVLFGITFTSVFSVLAIPDVSSSEQLVVTSWDTTSFTINWLNHASTSGNVNWMAFGT